MTVASREREGPSVHVKLYDMLFIITNCVDCIINDNVTICNVIPLSHHQEVKYKSQHILSSLEKSKLQIFVLCMFVIFYFLPCFKICITKLALV